MSDTLPRGASLCHHAGMGSYQLSRSVMIGADPALIHGLVNDLREWQAWSPWEGLDDDLERTYSGADRGVGCYYEWSGNRRAGRGSMKIVGSSPERIDVTTTFLKPFESTSDVVFRIVAADGGAQVTWEMSGEQTGLMSVLGRVVSMDRLVGKDFDKGLARLKAVAEA